MGRRGRRGGKAAQRQRASMQREANRVAALRSMANTDVQIETDDSSWLGKAFSTRMAPKVAAASVAAWHKPGYAGVIQDGMPMPPQYDKATPMVRTDGNADTTYGVRCLDTGRFVA